MTEWAGLQIHQNVAAQTAVIKNEIDVVVLATDGDTFLPGLETKALAQFEEKRLKMIKERTFKIGLQIFRTLREAGKLKHVRITDEIGNGLLRRLFPGAIDDRALVGREARAFVKQASDLTLELADGPIALQAFVLVESALPWVVQLDEFLQFGPRKPEQHAARKRGGQFGGH